MQAAAAASSSSGAGMKDIGRGGDGTRTATGGDVEDIPQKSWRERIATSIARSRKIRGGNYVQLATVDPETNEPRCRTVVFRGFQRLSEGGSVDSSCTMRMITDARSNKVREIMTSSAASSSGGRGGGGGGMAELVWWFGKSSEQYRVRGLVQYVGESYEEFPLGASFLQAADAGDDGDRRAAAVEEFLARARREQWGNLSDAAREQFFWDDPGLSYTGRAAAEVPPGGRDEDGKILPPPREFLLLLLQPHTVDYLRLTDNYRQVDELNNDSGKWVQTRVTP